MFCTTAFNSYADEDPSDLEIPFNRAGNLILLKGKVDSIEGNFILDTGAPGLVLNITYFRHYPTQVAEERSGVTGVLAAAAQTTINHFSFEG